VTDLDVQYLGSWLRTYMCVLVCVCACVCDTASLTLMGRIRIEVYDNRLLRRTFGRK